MANRFKKIIFFFLLVFSFLNLSCATVPLTGRRQIAILPRQAMLSESYRLHGEFIREHRLSGDQDQVQRVRQVGRRIQQAVERYMAEKGLLHRLAGYQWEFNLIEGSQINAWCMPGGKVAVYEGILPIAKDDDGLAVIIAHEVAHAVAEHGNERLSQRLLAEMGQVALSSALRKRPEETRKMWMQVYGVGAQYGALLPYSRLHENEADYLGLIFMAMAGYDPAAAVSFWERMMEVKQNGTILPEYLSTHPSDKTRIRNIKKNIPEAREYYKKSNFDE